MQHNTIRRQARATEDGGASVAGILDVTDNHGSLRVDGYLPGPRDAHVPPWLIREYGLRRGDTLTGTLGPRTRQCQTAAAGPSRQRQRIAARQYEIGDHTSPTWSPSTRTTAYASRPRRMKWLRA
ncbi:hypothetical protein ACFWPH_29665 [Nocardia sp. NPDC058499]|uniref:hypothetical protein n=1 Tax=Nocardia sp. NPDC058499 TaxID=3346530 RepID=UPI00365E9631